GAGRSTIGDTAANSIRNGGTGIRVDSTGGTRNAVRGNVIVGNGDLGIDLGANGQQNFPVLDTAFVGGTQVDGILDTVAGATFVVEIFATSTCDISGHGEGEELLAVQQVTTDGTGHAAFTVTLSRTVDGSAEHLTATATDSLGNTSEFSPCTPA